MAYLIPLKSPNSNSIHRFLLTSSLPFLPLTPVKSFATLIVDGRVPRTCPFMPSGMIAGNALCALAVTFPSFIISQNPSNFNFVISACLSSFATMRNLNKLSLPCSPLNLARTLSPATDTSTVVPFREIDFFDILRWLCYTFSNRNNFVSVGARTCSSLTCSTVGIVNCRSVTRSCFFFCFQKHYHPNQ